MAADRTLDRRAQRTRRLLGDALTALMQIKPYEKITVQDISDRANVGRSTFYAHYEGKDSLLSANFEWLVDQLSQGWEAQAPPAALFPVAEFLAHVRQHRVLYEALTRGRGLEFFATRGQAVIARRMEQRLERLCAEAPPPALPLPVLANFAAGALLALLRWWLDSKRPYQPEQLEAMFHTVLETGIGVRLSGQPPPASSPPPAARRPRRGAPPA